MFDSSHIWEKEYSGLYEDWICTHVISFVDECCKKWDPLEYDENLIAYTLIIFKEFIVGIVLGYIATVVFDAILMAGQMIDMQIGFGMVNVLDPISNIQIPITANFYYMISMMVLMASNGHHIIMRALFESYKFIPAGKAAFNNI